MSPKLVVPGSIKVCNKSNCQLEREILLLFKNSMSGLLLQSFEGIGSSPEGGQLLYTILLENDAIILYMLNPLLIRKCPVML